MDIAFDNPSGLLIDAAARMFPDRAGRISAWYNALAGLYATPALYLINTMGQECAIQLSRTWERVGDAAVIPAHSAQATCSGPISVANIARFEIRKGQYRLEIDRTKVRVTMPDGQVAFPAGTSTVAVGPIKIDMRDFGGTTAPAPGPAPAPTPAGVPRAILDLPDAPAINRWTTRTSTHDVDWSTSPHALASGPVIVENNTWNMKDPGSGQKGFHGLPVSDPDASIPYGRFRSRVGVGPALGNTVNVEIHSELPHMLPTPHGTDGEVAIYPSFIWGKHLGWGNKTGGVYVPGASTRLRDIRSLWVGWKSRDFSGSDFIGHLAHDMRTTLTDRATSGSQASEEITCEFMVVHDYWGGYGATSEYRAEGAFRGLVTIDGRQFRIFIQHGATVISNGQKAMLLCFVPVIRPLPDQFNLAPIIQYCISTRYRDLPEGPGSYRRDLGRSVDDTLLHPDRYLTQNGIGIEVDFKRPSTVHARFNTAFYRMNLD